MATQKTHDITIKVGEYVDNQGNKKGRYENIGAIFRRDDGHESIVVKPAFLSPSLLLQMQAGGLQIGDRVFLNTYEVRDGGNRTAPAPQQAPAPQAAAPSKPAAASGDFNDDIPF